MAAFHFRGAFHKVAGIKLHTRLGSKYLHDQAGLVAGYRYYRQLCTMFIQHKVMVIPLPKSDLPVVSIYAVADR